MTTGCATTTTNTTTAAASATTANFVYILSKEHAWVPARVISMFEQRQQAMVSVPMYHDEQSIQSDAGRKAKRQVQQVIDLKHHHYNQGRLPLQNVDENGRLQEVEDMVDLPFLHEAAILYNLKARHVQSKPYTRTGDIIIAVNPYQWITDLYTERTQAKYSQSLVWNHCQQQQLSSSFDDARKMVEPHVYEASALAYRGLALLGENQSILVSGESGAGKTETVKICMNHIASIQRGCCDTNNAMDDEEADRRSSNGSGSSNGSKGGKKSFISPVVQRVLDSNPLLEAFGNAKTVRNDNSSRFGKYIQLQFDVEDVVSAAYAGKAVPRCVLAGSKCEVYLLEKSRVVGHDEHERTYHIFYQLLAADDKLKTYFWEGLRGTNHESFNYVGWTDTHKIEGVTDARRFIKTLESLGLIGVRGAQLQTLMRALCIVLQLGNLVFEGNDGDEERAAIDLNDDFLALSELIGIQPAALEEAFLLRTVRARNEVYKVPLNVAKAKDSVDAFAKEIYAKTFLWLVRTINNATCAERNYDGDRKDGFGVIGLLDIFGFESFQTNRFEQLCINYANEKLQQKFTQDVFQSVQAEYQDEGIHLDEIKYDDNTNVLDLIEGKLGLLAVLNEECVRPKGNDTSFVAKALELNKTSPCLLTTKMFQSCAFGIVHFAGKVMYDATNFVSKNQDTLPTDLQECATKSSNGILAKELFNESTMVTTTTTTTRKSKGQEPPLARRQSNLMAATVWTKFRTQLNCLMASLKDTRTRYIRCIKPNSKKKALLMEHVSTVEQLRCAGVVAAVTISRSAFPNRLEHPIVLERFKSLWPKEGANALYDEEAMRRLVDNVLTQVLKPLEVVDKKRNVIVKAFVIGNTRAYFRAGALEYLEKERLNGMDTWATDIQRTARGFLARRRCRRVRAAVIVCQSHVRTFLVRHQLRRLYRACVFAQCWIRSLLAQRALANCRYSSKVMMIQNTWRARQTRITFLMYRQAALVVQTVARGFIQRRKFRRLMREKKEEASLTRQLEHLKAALREAEVRRLEAEQRAEERARQRFEEQWEEEKNLEAETAAITNEQQSLIEESTKIIEYLRKENAKLRHRNTKVQDDFDVIKRNNARLLEANASASESFAALNEYARQLNDSNSKLVKSLCSYKSRCAKLKEGLRRMHEHIKFNGSSSPVSVYQLLDPPEQIAI